MARAVRLRSAPEEMRKLFVSILAHKNATIRLSLRPDLPCDGGQLGRAGLFRFV